MENIDHKSMERIEIQANIFAKEILMPYESLMEVVRQYFKTERIFNNQLYLDDQPVNKALVYSLLRIISTTYNVSIQVAKNHLIDL